MSQSKLRPNRTPPAKIALTSSIETTSYSPSTPLTAVKDKKGSHKGLWKSLKSKASAFSIFDREKSPKPLQGGLAPPPLTIPTIPLASARATFEVEEEDKLKNEYDRTFRRSCDTDERKKAAARITISTASGEYDFAYRPKITLDTSAAQSDEVNYATANASTTALSAVSQKTNADDALLDFPDLGSDLARYIRDGTPTPSANATPVEEQAAVFGFIPFDERVESYDEDFEMGVESPEGVPKVVRSGTVKSVRFVSAEIERKAEKSAEEAVEVHRKMLADAKEAGKRDMAKLFHVSEDERGGLARSLLPRPASPVKRAGQESNSADNKPRTPSPTKTLRSKASATFISERSPSPAKSPLDHKESMTFKARRDDSPSRPPRGLTSPSKTSLLRHSLSSPSKSDLHLSYISPSKCDSGRASPIKSPASHTRPHTPLTPTRLTMENTRLNTPSSPTKLTPIRAHTPISPLKAAMSHNTSLAPAPPAKPTTHRSPKPTTPITAIRLPPARSHTPRSHTPPSPARPLKPLPSAHESMMRGKEAHDEALKRKAIEAAEMRKQTQEMLERKRVEEEREAREKQGKVALRRKASQGALISPALSRIPVPAPRERPQLVKKKDSVAQLRKPGIMGAPTAAATAAPSLTPTIATAKGVSQLKPKASMQSLRPKASAQSLRPKASTQSLRPKPSHNQLGQAAKTAPSKPLTKSKLAQEIERK